MPLGGDRKNKCQVEKIFKMAHKQGSIPLYILKNTLIRETQMARILERARETGI